MINEKFLQQRQPQVRGGIRAQLCGRAGEEEAGQHQGQNEPAQQRRRTPGGVHPDAHAVQVPRSVRLLRTQDLLADHALLHRGRRRPQEEVPLGCPSQTSKRCNKINFIYYLNYFEWN